MNKGVKIGLYVVLVVAAIYFGYNFFSRLQAVSESDTRKPAPTEQAAQPTPPADTNVQEGTTVTNEVILTDTNLSDTTTTSVVSVVTNEATNGVAEQLPPPPREEAEEDDGTTRAVMAKASRGKIWSYLGGFVGILIVLGLLVAYDVSQYLGNRSIDFIYNDDLKGVHDPDYEIAEQTYANGKPLEAIQILREYLRKNPRQQHAALRIAEIYEKDLGNHLAAALEYEEVLKHKLPRERWGWAAIHLCNLYSKLGKSDKTLELLRRIADEYSETAAAKKARKRLAMYESAGDSDALATDLPEDPNMPDIPPPPRPAAKKQEEEPPSNLPPGFRPKK